MSLGVMAAVLAAAGAGGSGDTTPLAISSAVVSSDGGTITLTLDDTDGDEAGLTAGDFTLGDVIDAAITAAVWSDSGTIALTCSPKIRDFESPTLDVAADAFFDTSANGNAEVTDYALNNASNTYWYSAALADCVGALRGDLGVATSGSDVTLWSDQSSASNDASAAANNPSHNGSDPWVTFDSASSELLEWDGVASNFLGEDPSTTVVAVVRATDVTTTKWIFGAGSTNDYHRLAIVAQDVNLGRRSTTSGLQQVTGSVNSLADNTWAIVWGRTNGTAADVGTDDTTADNSGTVNVTDNSGTSEANIGAAMNGASLLDGDVAAILAFNDNLDNTELGNVISELSAWMTSTGSF